MEKGKLEMWKNRKGKIDAKVTFKTEEIFLPTNAFNEVDCTNRNYSDNPLFSSF